MFTKNPGQLHRFYKDDSVFTHGSGQILESCQGVENIRVSIDKLELTSSSIDVFDHGSVDAQLSENGSVVVLICGLFTPAGVVPGSAGASLRFVQSFQLACQATGPGVKKTPSYYVRNSIFRTEKRSDSGEVAPVPAPVPASVVAPTPVPEPVVAAAAPAPKAEQPAALNQPAPKQASKPKAKHAKADASPAAQTRAPEPTAKAAPTTATDSPMPPAAAPAPVSVAPAPKEQLEPEPSGPRSFADLVKTWDPSAPVPPAATKPVPKAAPKPASTLNVPPAAANGKSADSTTSKRSMPTDTSVYISSVPAATTKADLAEALSGCGTVVRVDLHADRGFAFVNFDASECVAAAVAAGPLSLHGGSLRVESRGRSSESKSSGGRPNRDKDRDSAAAPRERRTTKKSAAPAAI